MQLPIAIHKDPDSVYGVSVPDVPPWEDLPPEAYADHDLPPSRAASRPAGAHRHRHPARAKSA